ncbi:MAG: FAD/NAD(P)-binding protein [Gammaproteobacteria bacterium]
MSAAPYMPIPATIERVTEETPSIKTFTVRPREPVPFAAGQFVELTVPGVGEAPFTPSSSPAVSEELDITIMSVGRVTERLHALGPGAAVGIRGPLGRAYPVEEFRGREILIAGGGCGVGPLRALIFALLENPDDYARIVVRYGARSSANLVFREAAAHGWGRDDALDVMMTVDVGDPAWDGHVGVLPTILTEEYLDCDADNGVAVLCGPPLMMRFTVMKLLERGYRPENMFLSLERNMSCGIGKCGHCRMGRYYVCKDGPVFSYAEVRDNPRLWDD